MLAIRCTLLRGEFEGGRADDPRSPEWPPSWMRLFSALVSVASEDDDALLELLEAAKPPHIHASQASEILYASRTSFVPTNELLDETRHTQLFGRTNGPRSWARVIPRSPQVTYVWPDLDLTQPQTRRLAELCRRVPYFGRSTSPTLVELVDKPPGEPALLPEAAVPADRFRLETVVRSPFPGSLLALRNAYQRRIIEGGEGGDVWEIGDRIGYGSESEPVGEDELQGPHRQLVIFSIENRHLDGRHAARVTHAFRRAILSRASQPLPALHGHHDGTVVQCAYLALPDVGSQHSDGHLLGVALAVPDLSPPELAVVANAVDTPHLDLTAGPLGVLRLRRLRPLEAQVAWGLRSRRWEQRARRWATVLPMVFDRFPGRGADLGAEVRRSVVNAGFPEPVRLGWSRRPFVPGGVSMAPRDTLRRPDDTPIRPYRHVWFEFDKKVQGPVVVGSMRHYGLGLCVPFEREPGDVSPE